MKNAVQVFVTIFAVLYLVVYVFVILALWNKCLPLAIFMICSIVASLLRDIVRKATSEERSKKQVLVTNIALLPVQAYIVYTLWAATGLAVLYGIMVLVDIFFGVLELQNEELFDFD